MTTTRLLSRAHKAVPTSGLMRAIRALLPGILVLALFTDSAGCLHHADSTAERPRPKGCESKPGSRGKKSPAQSQLQAGPAKPGTENAGRELTESELASVRGGSSKRHGTTAGVATPPYKPFTRKNFRQNLAQRTGGIPKNAQAHHVLPVKFERQCGKVGINIHDPKFGAWWKEGHHQRKARAYNDEWDAFFKNRNPTREEILQKGRDMAKEYGLAIGF